MHIMLGSMDVDMGHPATGQQREEVSLPRKGPKGIHAGDERSKGAIPSVATAPSPRAN